MKAMTTSIGRLLATFGGLLAAGGFAWQSAVLHADGMFLGSILGPGVTMASASVC